MLRKNRSAPFRPRDVHQRTNSVRVGGHGKTVISVSKEKACQSFPQDRLAGENKVVVPLGGRSTSSSEDVGGTTSAFRAAQLLAIWGLWWPVEFAERFLVELAVTLLVPVEDRPARAGHEHFEILADGGTGPAEASG